ncbi:MAG: acyl carrier protein [Bacteroidetes bacterium]|nr:MAG: acyl carrier protein [Bacteroidota bacterium]
MQKEDIIERVNLFLVEEFELEEEQLVAEALLKDDLDIESLDFVDIAVIIEKEFNFQMKTEEMAKLKTLNDFYNYLDQQLNK